MDRDHKLFRYLFENKIATQTQIGRDVFAPADKTTVNKRLMKLRNAKLIEVRPTMIKSRPGYTYGITKKGFDEMAGDCIYTVDQTILKSDSPRHDMMLVDLIHSFNRLSSVRNVITENALQCYQEMREDEDLRSYSKLHCDGVVNMEINGKRSVAALEYDRKAKSASRYVKKVREYYDYNNVHAVFYVCENGHIEDAILRIDEKVCSDKRPKFFVCLREDIQNNQKQMTFRNFKGQEIRVS